MTPEQQNAILQMVAEGASFRRLCNEFNQFAVMGVLSQNGYEWDRNDNIRRKAAAAVTEEAAAEEEEEEDAEEVETAEEPVKPKRRTREEEETPDGYPALLPIGGMPGYSVDTHGTPHATKKRGSKGGPIKPDRYWMKRGSGTTFVCGYRVRVNGVQKRYQPKYFHMARKIAEQKWENAEMSKLV